MEFLLAFSGNNFKFWHPRVNVATMLEGCIFVSWVLACSQELGILFYFQLHDVHNLMFPLLVT